MEKEYLVKKIKRFLQSNFKNALFDFSELLEIF